MIRKKHRSGFLTAAICAFAASILLLAVSAFADDTLTGLNISNLTVTYSITAGNGGGSAKPSGSGTKITATVKSGKTGSIFQRKYHSSTLNIALKNEFESDAELSFDLSTGFGQANGSYKVEIDGVEQKEPYAFTVKGKHSVNVIISSNENSPGNDIGIKVTIDITKFQKIEKKMEVTFVPGQHGSYTVDGNAITAETKKTKESTEAYALNATADAGYSFYGWKNLTTGDIESYDAVSTIYFSVDNSVVQPVFFPTGSAVFGVGSELFSDLNDANAYADSQTSNKTIVLLQNGTLSGDATISKGNLLLIPYDKIATANATSKPDTVEGKFVSPTHFRTLTIPDGVTLTVNGDINVNGQVLKLQSIPTGPHGLIALEENGKIVLNSGANLYCWGYINGEGKVIANSGSHVYECFQLRGWRGGSVTQPMLGNKQGVFPVNQYYIQNIEAELCIESGATESVYASVTVSVNLPIIGTVLQQAEVTDVIVGVDKGLFQLASGWLSKKYIPSEDRMLFTAEGEMNISAFSLQLKVGTQDFALDTEDYVLPIHGGFAVYIKSGTTTIPSTQRIALLPGAELTVAKDAVLNINSEMYIYDRDQWAGKGYGYGFGGGYGGKANCDFAPVTYATSRTPRTASSVVDAKVDVNGTINVSGKLYTTEQNSESETDGANITSSQGGGKIVFKSSADDATKDPITYQYVQGADKPYSQIHCDPAKLLNGDETYLETVGAKGPENGKPGWSYTYLTTDPEYVQHTDTSVYKDMWYRYRVIYKVNGQPTVKYITTDSDTFVLDQNIPLTGDKKPVVTTNNATATLDTTSRKIVLSEINGDCIVEFTSETVYKINVSWIGNLNFEYKPNIYKWDATTMCYVREQEAGWRSDNPTVTVTNDQTLGSTGNIKADVAFEKKTKFINSNLGMNFTIGDSTTPNSATMSDKLIPGKSVTAKMQLTGAPTGLASGANLTIGTVKIILTPVT